MIGPLSHLCRASLGSGVALPSPLNNQAQAFATDNPDVFTGSDSAGTLSSSRAPALSRNPNVPCRFDVTYGNAGLAD